jgi:hypothetical protein
VSERSAHIRKERIPKPIAALARLKAEPKNCPSPCSAGTTRYSLLISKKLPFELPPSPATFVKRALAEAERARRAEDSLLEVEGAKIGWVGPSDAMLRFLIW